MSENDNKEAPNIQELIDALNKGANEQGEFMLEKALEIFPLIDKLTSSSLKKVLKRLASYPYKHDYFEDIKLVPNDEMTPSELQLFTALAQNKDSYGLFFSFIQQARKLKQMLDNQQEQEKEDGKLD